MREREIKKVSERIETYYLRMCMFSNHYICVIVCTSAGNCFILGGFSCSQTSYFSGLPRSGSASCGAARCTGSTSGLSTGSSACTSRVRRMPRCGGTRSTMLSRAEIQRGARHDVAPTLCGPRRVIAWLLSSQRHPMTRPRSLRRRPSPFGIRGCP